MIADPSVAIGGSTGLDHESTAAIDEAARWLAVTPRHARGDRPIVPLLRDMFGLSAMQTCEAIREYRVQIGRAT